MERLTPAIRSLYIKIYTSESPQNFTDTLHDIVTEKSISKEEKFDLILELHFALQAYELDLLEKEGL